MGGGVSSKHAEAIAEFVTQKGKPGDASDVSTLEAAHTEIQKLRCYQSSSIMYDKISTYVAVQGPDTASGHT